jgi:addiction module HigA family antidote
LTIIKMKSESNRIPPVHPGVVLLEDFMKPLGLSAYAVAKAIGSTPIAISEITRRKRSVSPEMALKLGRLFNVPPSIWTGLQSSHDLELIGQKMKARLARIAPIYAES